MSLIIPINLAVEDLLSEAVIIKILNSSGRNYKIGDCYGRRGKSYLKKICAGLNKASRGSTYFLLTDLNSCECPPALINKWLPHGKNHNFIFRVASREIEAWVLAHREAFASFVGVNLNFIPQSPDSLPDPKRSLLEIVSKSKRNRLKSAILPLPQSTAKVGPDYNGTLSKFVREEWDCNEARRYSLSLYKTMQILNTFNPK